MIPSFIYFAPGTRASSSVWLSLLPAFSSIKLFRLSRFLSLKTPHDSSPWTESGKTPYLYHSLIHSTMNPVQNSPLVFNPLLTSRSVLGFYLYLVCISLPYDSFGVEVLLRVGQRVSTPCRGSSDISLWHGVLSSSFSPSLYLKREQRRTENWE